jgi:hypothetical protein
MFRPLVFAAFALAVAAQEKPNLFNAAPPEQEKALRERVTGFYQAYVDGRFRAAEQFVAEDTKDLHYNQEKTKIRGFEIIKVNWDDGFKIASVVTTVQTVIQLRGQNIPAAAPMATRWKLEDGKWCYFVDPAMGRATPMGVMKAGPGSREGMKIDDMIKNPNIILNQITVSKEKFLLRSWEKSADNVVVTNGMPGSVTLTLQTESIPGLTHKMERTELGPGETSRIELIYDPKDESAKPTLKASLKIEPFNRTIIIPVVFDIPEELKKQIAQP